MCTYSKSNESLLICIMVKSCGRYKTMISLETHTQRIFFCLKNTGLTPFASAGSFVSIDSILASCGHHLCSLKWHSGMPCVSWWISWPQSACFFIWICLNYGELTTIRHPKWFLSGWLGCVGFYHLVNTLNFLSGSNFTSFPPLYSKVCHSTMRKRGGSRNGEMLPMLAIGWLATAVRGGEAGYSAK